MALDTYAALQTEVLNWLARPGDPLVAPAVPTIISLFEREASRRLRVGAAETIAYLTAVAAESAVVLPGDCGIIRTVSAYTPDLGNGRLLLYLPPTNSGLIWDASGEPRYYTVVGLNLQLGPRPDRTYTVALDYLTDLPPLSDANPSNWLLQNHSDAYLFGALAEAELYIGHDERAGMWAQRREATFASIEVQDRKKRWPGPLQIRVDGITSPGGGGAAVPPGVPADTAGPLIVVSPASGETIQLEQHCRGVYVESAPGTLTIVLPPNQGMLHGEMVDINFSAPVSTLHFVEMLPGASVATPVAASPATGYGPGAAIVWRWLDDEGWVLWK